MAQLIMVWIVLFLIAFLAVLEILERLRCRANLLRQSKFELELEEVVRSYRHSKEGCEDRC